MLLLPLILSVSGESAFTARADLFQRCNRGRSFTELDIMTNIKSFGRSSPLGASILDGGVNFSLFSRTATRVELLLFDRVDDAKPARVILVDPAHSRSYHYWHVFVPGISAGQIYGYRVAGPAAPEIGLRFDSTKVLLDPYGRGVVIPKNYDRAAATIAGDNAATAMKSVVVDSAAYDWEGDEPLGVLCADDYL